MEGVFRWLESMSEYNLSYFVSLIYAWAVLGGSKCWVMHGYSVWYWIRLDFIKGDSWALAELHILLRAIIVFIVFSLVMIEMMILANSSIAEMSN